MAARGISATRDTVLTVCEEHRSHELLTLEQGKGRFVMMDDAMWGMILGKSGKIPGTIDPSCCSLPSAGT